MVAIVGYFYFGQDQRLKDEAAVSRAVLNATNWILDAGYRNVLVEVNNECNISYDHEILQPARVPELIKLVQSQTRNGRRLLVSTSFGGTTSGGPREHPDTPVTAAVAKQSDYLLIHGNGPNDPALIKRCIAATRELGGRSVPVMINEDPNFHFTEADQSPAGLCRRVHLVGLLRAGAEQLPGWIPEPASELDDQHGQQAAVLRVGQESDGSLRQDIARGRSDD